MSYRHALGTVGAAVIALLVPVVIATPAFAAPDNSARLSPGALSAMERDFGLTAQQAQAKVDRESALSRTDATLAQQLGSSYAGSWLDATTGALTVRTTDAAAVATIKAAGAEAVLSKKNPKDTKAKLDGAAKRAASTVGAWYVDEQSGTVVVETTKPADAQAFVAASGAAGDGVAVKQVASAPTLFANLVGGQAITVPYGDGTARCSIGFSATSGSTAYVITAGHCTELGGTWSGNNGVVIGPVASTAFPTDDFGSIRVNSTATWTPTSQVQGTSSMLGSTVAAIGASTCRSGSTTGYHCGTIQARNATVNYGGGDIVGGLTRTNACAEPGDSGGSFVSGRQAQGLTSGGSGNCTSGGTTFFQPINEALSRLGLTLVTG